MPFIVARKSHIGERNAKDNRGSCMWSTFFVTNLTPVKARASPDTELLGPLWFAAAHGHVETRRRGSLSCL